MSLPCEIVAQHLLPVLRVLIAKQLVKEHNLSQVAVAKRLGMTQAAVSQYLSSKRRGKLTKQLESDPSIQTMVKRLAQEIAATKETDNNIPINICEHCKALREKAFELEDQECPHPNNPQKTRKTLDPKR